MRRLAFTTVLCLITCAAPARAGEASFMLFDDFTDAPGLAVDQFGHTQVLPLGSGAA